MDSGWYSEALSQPDSIIFGELYAQHFDIYDDNYGEGEFPRLTAHGECLYKTVYPYHPLTREEYIAECYYELLSNGNWIFLYRKRDHVRLRWFTISVPDENERTWRIWAGRNYLFTPIN